MLARIPKAHPKRDMSASCDHGKLVYANNCQILLPSRFCWTYRTPSDTAGASGVLPTCSHTRVRMRVAGWQSSRCMRAVAKVALSARATLQHIPFLARPARGRVHAGVCRLLLSCRPRWSTRADMARDPVRVPTAAWTRRNPGPLPTLVLPQVPEGPLPRGPSRPSPASRERTVLQILCVLRT